MYVGPQKAMPLSRSELWRSLTTTNMASSRNIISLLSVGSEFAYNGTIEIEIKPNL